MRRWAALLCLVLAAAPAAAEIEVTRIDMLAAEGFDVNAAGPVLVRMDADRGRLVAANANSSSMTFIDCATGAVTNIPIGGRALQHLKDEALAIRRLTGEICLIGPRCFYVVSPEEETAVRVETPAQFESIAVDEKTGNVFVAGRESSKLGMWRPGGELELLPWTDREEPLVNLNQTPPPPIRKVVAYPASGRIAAIDGFTSTLALFDGATGKLRKRRDLPLAAKARWHLAGADDEAIYVVVETARRRVVEAGRIDLAGDDDLVVALPGLTEGVGIVYNPARGEICIPYDNAATVHVVDVRSGGDVFEIAIPAYGNDATAIDATGDTLYVASWAHGEIDVVDLAARRLVRRHTGLGIIPHMFSMAIDPASGRLYFPKGASAVNGTFGSAVSVFDPATGDIEKIHTGHAPVDLRMVPARRSVLVFGAEDEMLEWRPGRPAVMRRLPVDYPVRAVAAPGDDVYLSYGPHQSYWPNVYIWDARDGILTIRDEDLSFYDRRIPRQALEAALVGEELFFTQNNWGREAAFLGTLPDGVRLFEPARRVVLPDTVDRENTQRILRYDPAAKRLYRVRAGERDGDPGVLVVVDPATRAAVGRVELGRTATDLAVDDLRIYVTAFDDDRIDVVNKTTLAVSSVATAARPLRLCRCLEQVWAITHRGRTLERIEPPGKAISIPFDGLPDNLFAWRGTLVVTVHSPGELVIAEYDLARGTFSTLWRERYPYGDTAFDSANVSFYLRGQFADALPAITRHAVDVGGRLVVSDFLSGRIFVIGEK
ncbi:MAG: hypothetical protein JW876_06450 [Candidatus Krumholzibacteriota bacterium]|nr:hypothetical protein [Candidatus Krumholzibacteriota bacterium]